MKKIYGLSVGILAVLPVMVTLAEEVPAPAVPAPASTSSTQPQQTQPAPEKVLRNPFWPPDYWPQKKDPFATQLSATNQVSVVTPDNGSQAKTNVPPPDNVIHWPELKVNGLIKQPNGTYSALIEGIQGVVDVGQKISKVRNGRIFRWQITIINEKGIFPQKLETKPLKR